MEVSFPYSSYIARASIKYPFTASIPVFPCKEIPEKSSVDFQIGNHDTLIPCWKSTG